MIYILSKIWTSSQYVRFIIQLLVFINVLAFLEAMRVISQVETKLELHGGLGGPCRDVELKMKLFANQRNSYIAGFNVFLSLVIFRLYVTMKQIHEWRREMKDKDMAEKLQHEQQAGKKKDN
jgi:hypothetical protein